MLKPDTRRVVEKLRGVSTSVRLAIVSAALLPALVAPRPLVADEKWHHKWQKKSIELVKLGVYAVMPFAFDEGAVEISAYDPLTRRGARFVDAESSPNGKPLLIVSNDVSGTLQVFEIRRARG